jgi:acyl-CoA synthetase (NDP forming)
VLETVAADPAVDAIIPILTPTAVSPTERVLDAQPVDSPVAAVLPGQPEALTLHAKVPVYTSTTAAVRAVSHAADYAASLIREPGTVPELAVTCGYGLPVAPSTVVHDAETAVKALTALGGSVAMKPW